MTAYNINTFLFVFMQRDAIRSAASAVGVSTSAVAGAIAEENNSIRTGLTPFLEGGQTAFVASLLLLPQSVFEAEFQRAKANPLLKPSLQDKLNNITLNDVGPGNIKIATAIALLQQYEADFPDTDPLGLKHYSGNYAALISDLMDSTGDATPKFAALMLAEAQKFFTTNAPVAWAAMTPDEQDALLITYYNLGRAEVVDRMEKARAEWEASHPPEELFVYSPQVGSGGDEHLENAETIKAAIGGSFGDQPLDPEDVLADLDGPYSFPDDLISVPQTRIDADGNLVETIGTRGADGQVIVTETVVAPSGEIISRQSTTLTIESGSVKQDSATLVSFDPATGATVREDARLQFRGQYI